MAAVAFVSPTSPLHSLMSEVIPSVMLDLNRPFSIDDQWINEPTHYPVIPGSDEGGGGGGFGYDHPTVSVMSHQSLNDSVTPSIAQLLPDDVSFDSWQRTCPELWSSDDVLNLIYFIAMQSSEIEFSNFYGEKFQDLTGAELCSMTEEDFVCRDPKYGKMLHGCLRNLLRKSHFLPPEDLPAKVKQEKSNPGSLIQPEIPASVREMTFDDSCCFEEVRPNFVDLFGLSYDIDTQSDFLQLQTSTSAISDRSNGTQANEIHFRSYQYPNPTQQQHPHRQPLPSHHHQQQQQLQQLQHLLEFPILPDSTGINVIPGDRPRNADGWSILPSLRHPKKEREHSVSSEGESSSEGSSSGSHKNRSPTTATISATNTTNASSFPQNDVFSVRTMNGGKGNHLWEFLCQQLKRSVSIPTKDRIIQWESQEEGVFRILDSKEISTQWGLFKGNDKMTYEKLSRALRWCRTNGFLASLPKDGKFPKKLCFRFGPKATNWKDFV